MDTTYTVTADGTSPITWNNRADAVADASGRAHTLGFEAGLLVSRVVEETEGEDYVHYVAVDYADVYGPAATVVRTWVAS